MVSSVWVKTDKAIANLFSKNGTIISIVIATLTAAGVSALIIYLVRKALIAGAKLGLLSQNSGDLEAYLDGKKFIPKKIKAMVIESVNGIELEA